MSDPDEIYVAATRIFGVVIAVFGLVITGVTLANGGGITSAGLWFGLVFFGLGAGRTYLAQKKQ